MLPYDNSGQYAGFGKVVRFNPFAFSASEVTVLDLTLFSGECKGFSGGFAGASDSYGYMVPYYNGED